MSGSKIIAVMGATGAQGGGLARAILADASHEFTARVITRKPDSEKARALAALGAEVVAADADDAASLEPAFRGAWGAFCVTNFWEHFSPEREYAQATAMARATGRAGVKHVVWSTLEDTRKSVPLDDPRIPTLRGKYKVPHFDMKGAADEVFTREGGPTSFLLAAYYWENLIHFGAGPRRGDDGKLVLVLPLGGVRIPGMAVEDIGRCALGIFRLGPAAAGQRFGISGENLTGAEMAQKLGRAMGREITFYDMPFDAYRALGFPGADDLGNMFQYQALLGETFQKARDPGVARKLNPQLSDFDTWLAAHAKQIPIG